MVNSRSCCLPLWCREKREVALVIKILPANAGDVRNTGWISGLGRSPEKENCSPFPYSCLENPMDRGAWTAGSSVAWASPWGYKESDTTEDTCRMYDPLLCREWVKGDQK